LDFIGDDLKDSDCLLIDNIVDEGHTLRATTNEIKKRGARRIFMAAPHGLFSGKAVKTIEGSILDELYVTNTIPIMNQKQSEMVHIVSVGKLIAEAIHKIHLETLKENHNEKGGLEIKSNFEKRESSK